MPVRATSHPAQQQTAHYDAIIIGSGPNGLCAGITLAKAGLKVLILEAHQEIGGGARTAQLTLPGFWHDTCSAIHPTGVVSPLFRSLHLESLGVEWIQPPIHLAHPLDNGSAALLFNSLAETGSSLGPDSDAWEKMFSPFLSSGFAFFEEILRPIRIPRHPLLLARFGLLALRSSEAVINSWFQGEAARALFTGCAGHSIVPLDRAGTASFGIVLALAGHAIGWPCVRGGSISITRALEKIFLEYGGEIKTGWAVRRLSELPRSRTILFDTSPRQMESIAAEELPTRFRRRLTRFRQGPGVFKVDWALAGPIPWKNKNCSLAATVHVGGTAEEIMRAECQVGNGKVPDRPFVLVAQQSLFDPTRAPVGKHTGWAYCHVPNGCDSDMTERIEHQIERFAPGFRDLILARHTISPSQYESYNPTFIGGNIGGGANDLWQTIFRPFAKLDPYSTPNPRLFLCSSSTPPAGGVHGMCGYWAARSALRKAFGITRMTF